MRSGVPSGVEPKPVAPEKPDRAMVVASDDVDDPPAERDARRDDAARETRAARVGHPAPSGAAPEAALRAEVRPSHGTDRPAASGAGHAAAVEPVRSTSPRAPDAGVLAGLQGPDTPAARRLTITMNQVYVGVAVLLALVVAIWAIAWNLGGSSREKDLLSGPQLPEIGGSNAGIRDPLASGNATTNPPATGTDTPRTARGEDASAPARPNPAGGSRTDGATGSGLYLVSGGSRGTDPRQDRTNYLRLATGVSAADARAAVDFLKAQGIEALATPQLDSRGAPKNNPPRYDLFGLFGIPSDRYSAMADERERYTLRIIEAGERWRATGGAMKFIEPSWERFKP
jgi:hypothetical protein